MATYEAMMEDGQDDDLVQEVEKMETSSFDESLLDDGQDDDLIEETEKFEALRQLGGGPSEEGSLRYEAEPMFERNSQRFGVHERVVRLRPVQEGHIPTERLADALTRGLRGAVGQVLDRLHVPDRDRFYVSLGSDRLRNASNAFFVTAGEWRQDALRAKTLLENLSKMLNSDEQFEMDDSFKLSVVHARPPPRGTGKRKYTPGHQSNVRFKQMKRSVIKMPRDEQGWCAARAIVTAKALHLAGHDRHERDAWIDVRRKTTVARRQHAAQRLADEVRLAPGAWGPDGLTLVAMAPSLYDYKILVVDASRAYSVIPFGHGDIQLGLLYDDGHYDTLTDVAAFLGQKYLCPVCWKPYDNQGQHRCDRNKGAHCTSCVQEDCLEQQEAYRVRRSPALACPHCHRHFYGKGCLARHRWRIIQRKDINDTHPSVCQDRQKCPDCLAYLRGKKEIDRHRCGHGECYSCRKYVNIAEHQCYIQVKKLKEDTPRPAVAARGANAGLRTLRANDALGDDLPETVNAPRPPVHVFFDIEAMQGEDRHIPNLVVCQRIDEDRFHHWQGVGCVRAFLECLTDWCEESQQPLVVIAHNFQGYDSYPVIEKLHEMRAELSQIRNGGKVLQLKALFDSVRFIDSLSFFGMKLSKFPKTFGLTELKKGYFAHLFNKEENQEYEGDLPPVEDYLPNTMSVEEKQEFLKWHAEEKARRHAENDPFIFQKELLEYCQSDVRLLKEGCMVFMREFKEIAQFDRFELMTIASACNRFLRTHCLEEETIAVDPLWGWGGRKIKQSPAAFEWMEWEAKTSHRPIRHAQNGGEFRPLPGHRYTVDGYHEETRTVYEFDGCFWHGCPTCFPVRDETHARHLGKTMADVFRDREKKHALLRQAGYRIVSKWECEWKEERQHERIQDFL